MYHRSFNGPAPRSFSGAHRFRPQCLADALREDYEAASDLTDGSWSTERLATEIDDRLEEAVYMLTEGYCPRCMAELQTIGGISGAGSRVTQCRCIPICAACGEREGMPCGTAITPLAWLNLKLWALDKEADARRSEYLRKATITVGVGAADGHGRPAVITEDGVRSVKLRPHPGGWEEFGYTEDEPDLDK